MKIVVFTLTRDRLAFTKHCFKGLQEKAGYPYGHYVVDNGSEDGTVEWLQNPSVSFQLVVLESSNLGIAWGINRIKTMIPKCDLVVKMDNDCEVVTPNILAKIVKLYENLSGSDNWVLSPRVEGLIKPPNRFDHFTVSNVDPRNTFAFMIGNSHVVGGLFRVMPYKLFTEFTADESLPKAYGVDGQLAKWCVEKKVNMGYIENLEVKHYLTTEGQMKELPDYFLRKFKEEKNEI